MKIQIISNKDGCSGDRHKTYETAGPCSYKIVKDREVIGYINQMIDSRFPASRTHIWVASLPDIVIREQYIRTLKTKVIAHIKGGQA